MRIVVVGAGGHARSVIEAIRSRGEHELVGCTDPRDDLKGTTIDGVQVLGDDSVLAGLLADAVTDACIGVGGSADNGPRARVFADVQALGFSLPPIVHRDASVASSAQLGEGDVILAGSVVGAGAQLGPNVIVNNGAVVEHGSIVGANAHVATGALLGGDVTVGADAHIGIGASVKQGVRIGKGAVIGAGSVVIRHVEDNARVAGSPAGPLPPPS